MRSSVAARSAGLIDPALSGTSSDPEQESAKRTAQAATEVAERDVVCTPYSGVRLPASSNPETKRRRFSSRRTFSTQANPALSGTSSDPEQESAKRTAQAATEVAERDVNVAVHWQSQLPP
jgi:hypothetical protein